MARSLRIEFSGAHYHITSRGNERKYIYRTNKDREKFLSYLKSAHLKYGAVIHAFCLMNNHYHIFMETPRGNLSQIMLHINGAYTNYFNFRHKRRGHLFQGRYKAILVEADSYAAELSRYIHLNPVRASMVNRPDQFKWSSYQHYVGKKKRPDWMTVDFILGYFDVESAQAQRKYQDFVNSRINVQYESPLERTVASTILGSDSFIEQIKDKYIDRNKKDRSVPAVKELIDNPEIQEIYNEVEVLCNDKSLSRNMTIYLLHTFTDMRLKEIGSFFKIGDTGVSAASRRFSMAIERSRKLRKQVERLRNQLDM